MKPSVSVIIPVYNGAHVIGEQLKALSRQDFPFPFEVLVCDNGSSDNLYQIIQETNYNFDLKIIDASQRKGASYARNVGAINARADYLAFCDCDDFVSPIWLKSHYETLLESDNSVVYGSAHKIEDNPYLKLESNAVQDIFLMSQKTSVIESWTLEVSETRSNIKTVGGYAGNMSIRKLDYLRIGGFDCSFPAAEDLDFTLRFVLDGGQSLFISSAAIAYRARSSQKSTIKQKRAWVVNDILLSIRFREHGQRCFPGFLGALQAVPLQYLEYIRRGESVGQGFVNEFATNLGVIEGTIKYRILKRIPPRELIDERVVANLKDDLKHEVALYV